VVATHPPLPWWVQALDSKFDPPRPPPDALRASTSPFQGKVWSGCRYLSTSGFSGSTHAISAIIFFTIACPNEL
jgi:hypothetical protein